MQLEKPAQHGSIPLIHSLIFAIIPIDPATVVRYLSGACTEQRYHPIWEQKG